MVDHSRDGYYMSMAAKGFSRNTVDATRKHKCPNCSFEFALVYGRTTACRGCAEVVKNCPKIRCPKCDYEWYLREVGHIADKHREHQVADHISDIITDYYDSQGWKKNR